MAEVFTNHYTFPDRAAVPPRDAMREAVNAAVSDAITYEHFDAAGSHGAWRDWLQLELADGTMVWVFWDPAKPHIEVQSTGLMLQRMTALNAPIIRLGGTPGYTDEDWHLRAAAIQRGRWLRLLTQLLIALVAIAVIIKWGWWGLAGVAATVVVAGIIFYIGLARAFARG